MTPNYQNPVQWGQTKKIGPGAAVWQQGRPIPITNLDRILVPTPHGREHITTPKGAIPGEPRIPKVQNISLAVTGSPGGQCVVRWQLDFGCGGATSQVLIDSNGFQQLSLSADWLRLSLVATNIGQFSGTGFVPPDTAIEAAAFFADGTTCTDSPTFTEFVSMDANSVIQVPPPNGATAFRILGDPSNLTPFSANQSYAVNYVGGALIVDRYAGDEIYGVRLSPIPITGGSELLIITNGDPVNGCAFGIAWELDF